VDDDFTVIGVVSEADLLTKEALDGGHTGMHGMISGMLHRREQQRAAALTAGDLMTHPAVTVKPGDTVEHAARLMYARRVKRLPVTDASGHLVGIVSRADVLAVYSRPDEEIRKEICDEVILNEFLTDPARFTVTVQGGIVTPGGQAGERPARPRPRQPGPPRPGRRSGPRPAQLPAARAPRQPRSCLLSHAPGGRHTSRKTRSCVNSADKQTPEPRRHSLRPFGA
jgi:hypothetical protein